MAVERKNHIIDAANKALGRLASEISVLLRGKHKPDFVPNQDCGDFVTVKNIQEVKFTGKKLEKKTYFRHSDYLGGVKIIPLSKLQKENPAEVLKRAVLGMLPKNKLKAKQIKRLRIG